MIARSSIAWPASTSVEHAASSNLVFWNDATGWPILGVLDRRRDRRARLHHRSDRHGQTLLRQVVAEVAERLTLVAQNVLDGDTDRGPTRGTPRGLR
jgi:hypothetical protein